MKKLASDLIALGYTNPKLRPHLASILDVITKESQEFDYARTSNVNYDIVKTPISDIVPGDTLLHNGVLKTVSRNDIKNDPFMGTSIFGDSYGTTRGIVDKAVIFRAMP